MRKSGLEIEPGLVTHANFSMESGYIAMVGLLSATELPDAVFASSDAVAIGAIAAIQDAGHHVPRDIAVASVDDIGAARFFRPALTTVTSEPYASGKLAAELLIELMKGERPASRSILVDTRLIVRGSTVEDYSDDLLLAARKARPDT
jgi:DNA-binding LacI/PurR family transcriptional regulator